jgi:hypothetical protein
VPLSLATRLNRGIAETWDRVVASLAGGGGQAASAASDAASSGAADELSARCAQHNATSTEPPLIRITHEAHGGWTVSSPAGNFRGIFVDLKRALAFARQSHGAAAATLWLSVDGLFIIIPQEAGWPQPVVGDAR